jgi:hypothetical protein
LGDPRPFGELKPFGDVGELGFWKPLGDWPFGELKAFGDVGEFGFWKPLGDCCPFGEVGLFGVPFCAVGLPAGCMSLGDDGDPFVVGCPPGGPELAVGCELVGACMAGALLVGPPAVLAGVAGCEAAVGCVFAVAGPLAGVAPVAAGAAAVLFGFCDGVVVPVLPPDCGVDGVPVAGTSVG